MAIGCLLQMIHHLDQTIEALLKTNTYFVENNVDISFATPLTVKDNSNTLNLYLYNIQENKSLRKHQWETKFIGNGAQKSRAPLFMECNYLITSWGENPLEEHLMLAECLITLANSPILPKAILQGALSDLNEEIQTQLSPKEDQLKPIDVWPVLGVELRPSLAYSVTLPVSLAGSVEEYTIVTDMEIRYQQIKPSSRTSQQITSVKEKNSNIVNQSANQNSRRKDDERISAYTTHVIAGTVRHKNQIQAGIVVKIKGDAIFVETNQKGQFRIGRLNAGSYKLQAFRVSGELLQEIEISVPNKNSKSTYDIEL